MDHWETHEISERFRDTGGGDGRSAGTLEAELLDAGLKGGGLEAEQLGGAVRAADAPAGLVQRGQDLRALGVGEGRGASRTDAAADPNGTWRVELSLRMIARSITFRNSRMLPGHG